MNEIDPAQTASPSADSPGAATRALDVEVTVRCEAWQRSVPDVAALCGRAVRAAVDGAAGEIGLPAELSVLLADDAFVRDLNRRFRQRDATTNVLSFPATDGAAGILAAAVPEPVLLGDVVVAYETVARESAEQSKSLADHLTHLVVHGVLHLLGYDHTKDVDVMAMESLETRVLDGLGIADPYRAATAGRSDAAVGQQT